MYQTHDNTIAGLSWMGDIYSEFMCYDANKMHEQTSGVHILQVQYPQPSSQMKLQNVHVVQNCTTSQ